MAEMKLQGLETRWSGEAKKAVRLALQRWRCLHRRHALSLQMRERALLSSYRRDHVRRIPRGSVVALQGLNRVQQGNRRQDQGQQNQYVHILVPPSKIFRRQLTRCGNSSARFCRRFALCFFLASGSGSRRCAFASPLPYSQYYSIPNSRFQRRNLQLSVNLNSFFRVLFAYHSVLCLFSENKLHFS